MLHVVDSRSKGLEFSIDISHTTELAIMDALLVSSGVMFVKLQNDPYYVRFKVDANDAGKIRTLVEGWHTAISDIQYGVSTRRNMA